MQGKKTMPVCRNISGMLFYSILHKISKILFIRIIVVIDHRMILHIDPHWITVKIDLPCSTQNQTRKYTLMGYQVRHSCHIGREHCRCQSHRQRDFMVNNTKYHFELHVNAEHTKFIIFKLYVSSK